MYIQISYTVMDKSIGTFASVSVSNEETPIE